MTKQPNAYPLRINTDIMERLKALADFHGRSLNKEIEWALKNYVLQNQPKDDK